MDPNATLAELRAACADLRNALAGLDGGYIEAAERMESAFTAMDEWLSSGGWRPAGWERPRRQGIS